jgi:hypothetical protein
MLRIKNNFKIMDFDDQIDPVEDVEEEVEEEFDEDGLPKKKGLVDDDADDTDDADEE